MKQYMQTLLKEQDDLILDTKSQEPLSNTNDEEPLYRILHIEDNPFDTKWLSAVITKSEALTPHKIVHTRTLANALKLLKQEPFDLVVSDLTLPDSNSDAAIKTIATRFPATPTVVLTASDEPEVAANCIKHGATDYFVKQRTQGRNLMRALKFAIIPR